MSNIVAQKRLACYAAFSKLRWLNYRNKIFLVTFLGIHLPLICLIAYQISIQSITSREHVIILGVILAATLIGTATTLLIIHHLLRPVTATTEALQHFMDAGQLDHLPTDFNDEAGKLMAITQLSLEKLDRLLKELTQVDTVTGLSTRDFFLQGINSRLKSTPDRDECAALVVVRIANYFDLVSSDGQQATNSNLRNLAFDFEYRLGRHSLAGYLGNGVFACFFSYPQEELKLRRDVSELLDELCLQDEIRETLTLRAGISLFPEHSDSPEQLLDYAVAAAASAERRSDPVVFSPRDREFIQRRLQLGLDLHKALMKSELMLFFQPVIDIHKGRIIGAEALIRWRHPEKGLISPTNFIPHSEHSGQIDNIGFWVLHRACEQISVWSSMGYELKIAVNLSAHQLKNERLLSYIKDMVERYHLRPGMLELELTETAALDSAAHALQLITELDKLGINASVDDLGTGFGGLDYLRLFPKLNFKIDRSFVKNLQENHNHFILCKTLLALGNSLGCNVTAEGVETEREFHTLREQGCNLYQGYWFSEPIPADEFTLLLQDANLAERLQNLQTLTMAAPGDTRH